MHSDDGKVIFLKFHSAEQDEDAMCFMACRHCRNKTFTHTWTGEQSFPLVRCAACGNHIGRIGWANGDDDLPKSPDN